MTRTYLDHNATTPVHPDARAAMLAAMDLVGNPASVHAEGQAAKGLLERCRADVAALVGCSVQQVIFTGSATEAAALAVAQKAHFGDVFAALPTEHDCFAVWSDADLPSVYGGGGELDPLDAGAFASWVAGLAGPEWAEGRAQTALVAISAANSETGVMLPTQQVAGDDQVNAFRAGTVPYGVVCDITQLCGKAPVIFGKSKPSYMVLSAHKIGGPKGVGALINFTAEDPQPILRGGGQEMGRRSGTENLIGIAGFAAAARAAKRDVEDGRWDRVAKLRNILESALEDVSKETIFVGKDARRLPNTSCVLTAGWKGETQVMQMDLAGFAISAGSACSSGKVKASSVLRAMGYDETEASSAIRVSLGLETTEDEVMRFVQAWGAAYERYKARAA